MPAKHKMNSPPTCAIILRMHKCSCRSKPVIPKTSSKLGWDAFLGDVLSQTAQEFHLNTLGFLNVDVLKTENTISASGSASHCLNASISSHLTCCKERRCSCWIPALKKTVVRLLILVFDAVTHELHLRTHKLCEAIRWSRRSCRSRRDRSAQVFLVIIFSVTRNWRQRIWTENIKQLMNPSFAANLRTPVSLLPWRLAELQKISKMDRTTN